MTMSSASILAYYVLPFYEKIETILTAFLKQSFRSKNANVFVKGQSVFKQAKWKRQNKWRR